MCISLNKLQRQRERGIYDRVLVDHLDRWTWCHRVSRSMCLDFGMVELVAVPQSVLFACWFQSAQTSQPTVFFSHNRPALANPNQPKNQQAAWCFDAMCRAVLRWPSWDNFLLVFAKDLVDVCWSLLIDSVKNDGKKEQFNGAGADWLNRTRSTCMCSSRVNRKINKTPTTFLSCNLVENTFSFIAPSLMLPRLLECTSSLICK